VIEPWFEGVVARARAILTERPTSSAGPIFIEDAASGPILIEVSKGDRVAAASMDR
jgi:hypothetical protein